MKTLYFRKEIAPHLPKQPGVYLMKNKEGKIIYVGKAKNIKNRVTSYFSGKKELKTALLVKSVHQIETIITEKESEALLLENTLIKKEKPKYNINLKDGKTYPMLCISTGKWPRIYKTRQIKHNGSFYAGPFTDSRMLDILIELIHQLFPLRRCKGKLRKREFPCLYYHLDQCCGPCIEKVSLQEYQSFISEIKVLTSGDNKKLKTRLLKKMQDASKQTHFEAAAKYRDALQALAKLDEKQDIIDFNPEIRDYINYSIEEDEALFAVFQMRDGRLSGRDLIPLSPIINEEETLSQFLFQYYQQYHAPPERIIVQSELDFHELSQALSIQTKRTITLSAPKSSREQSILNMAKENCKHELYRKRQKEGKGGGLTELKQLLNLPQLPTRIEGFDIAQLHGKHTVASLISFRNGKPQKSEYRSFNIKSLKGKIDDFEAIREAMARRYSRLINEKKTLPNLIVIDGGAGQVSAAGDILDALQLNIPLIGLAKEEEAIFRRHEAQPIILAPGSEALRILQAVRDETHKIATTKSRKQRLKDLTFSSLESIEGIGPKRSQKLMLTYGSVENIRQQTAQQLNREIGISIELAKCLLKKI